MLEVPFVLVDPSAAEPRASHPGDAGYDLRSIERVELAPGERGRVRTGVAVELPEGTAGLVVPRSGLAANHGVTVLNNPGLIDAGFRGELEVCLLNTDRAQSFTVECGDRIAQLVIVELPVIRLVAVTELSGSVRGARGYGSTGRD